jgi:hypothetical protein
VSPKEGDSWSLKKCIDDEDLKWQTGDWKRSGEDKAWEFSIRSKIDWKDYDECEDCPRHHATTQGTLYHVLCI